MADECCGIMGWLFGHKFEAVYSYGEPTITIPFAVTYMPGDIQALEASKKQTYKGHVCKRCGTKIEREAIK